VDKNSQTYWSKHRKDVANGVASILYGVVAIMSAELGLQPGKMTPYELACGALLVGLAMALTHGFVDMVKRETEQGTHLGLGETQSLVGSSLLVLTFPATVAIAVLVGALCGLRPGTLADVVPYVSVIVVVFLGFGSSYVLDRDLKPAFLRSGSWTLLCLVLFAAKQLE
jgi:4-hydroxybenzoate polyprenyltransferase